MRRHNMMTCFDSSNGKTFIAGRTYQSMLRLYNKKIRSAQKRSVSSSKMSKLYEKKNNVLNDYLHKVTRAVVNYCVENNIATVIIGDITGVRDGKDLGNKTNQKLHSFPYAKIYAMLEYKLKLKGISLFKQEESFTSQCSPKSPKVSKRYAVKKNRIQRGLYTDGKDIWNADTVGAFNILRKFLSSQKKSLTYEQGCIKAPYVLKVAV